MQSPASASVPIDNPLSRGGRGADLARRRGFSLVELLVVLGIVVVLLGLMMPGLREVREATRRLQCGNHMRTIGMAIVAYSSDHHDLLPRSVHAERKAFHNLMALSVNEDVPAFDGLGLLLPFGGRGYIDNRACFFCPSHCGEHEADRNMPRLIRPGPVRVFGNYHYRGHLRQGSGDQDSDGGPMRLGIHGDQTVLLTDGLRTRSDFNHVKGTNFLRSDMSVHWWFDAGNAVFQRLPEAPGGEGQNSVFQELFQDLLSDLERTSH